MTSWRSWAQTPSWLAPRSPRTATSKVPGHPQANLRPPVPSTSAADWRPGASPPRRAKEERPPPGKPTGPTNTQQRRLIRN